MQKAFHWLDEQGIAYTFHDYKKEGISTEKLQEWVSKVALTDLVNNKGTTYRNLTENEKKALTAPKKAIAIMQQHTSVIKRPLVEYNGKVLLGFDNDVWAATLS